MDQSGDVEVYRMKMSPEQLHYAKWSALGFITFTVLYGLYLLGVSSGAAQMELQLQPPIRALTIEANELRGKVTELELTQVSNCALQASEAVLNCEELCALEVNQALEGCTLLLCGEVKEVKK